MEEKILEAVSLRKEFKLTVKQCRERRLNVPTLVAVDDLSLHLESGEIYGLLGPNGAGKTTTLRMLSSLIEPSGGKVLFRGEDIQKNISAYRGKVAFLTSELKLDDFFTPDFTFTYFANLYGMKPEETERRKEELFTQFGISRFAQTQIKNLSTGMKQKVSLAVALCHDPEVIIFDEPTNGLDIIASREVENFLVNLRAKGKAIIISTHIFSLVEKLCDRVGIIDEGKLKLEGEMKTVCAEKSLEDVFFGLVDAKED